MKTCNILIDYFIIVLFLFASQYCKYHVSIPHVICLYALVLLDRTHCLQCNKVNLVIHTSVAINTQ